MKLDESVELVNVTSKTGIFYIIIRHGSISKNNKGCIVQVSGNNANKVGHEERKMA
jgi:hypothetical protein